MTAEHVKSTTVHKPKSINNNQAFFYYTVINPGVGLQLRGQVWLIPEASGQMKMGVPRSVLHEPEKMFLILIA